MYGKLPTRNATVASHSPFWQVTVRTTALAAPP